MHPKRRLKLKERSTAISTVQDFFEKAKLAKDVASATKCVYRARRLAMKFKLPLPRMYKRSFCRSCNAFGVSGRTCTIRTRDHKLIYTCLVCKKIRRFVLK